MIDAKNMLREIMTEVRAQDFVQMLASVADERASREGDLRLITDDQKRHDFHSINRTTWDLLSQQCGVILKTLGVH